MILQRKKYTALNTIAWVITQRQSSLDIIINYKFYEHHHHHPPRLTIRITLFSNLSYQKTSINKNICEYYIIIEQCFLFLSNCLPTILF